MNDIYIIIKQAFKKKEIYPKIYPHDSKEITKDNLYKSSTKEQIFIHRDNWGLYYIYKKKLSYNQYIAICVFSDRLCTNYNELKLGFRMLISEMSRVRLFIKDNHNLINGQSIQNQKVNLDIFLRENKDYIDSAFKKSQDIPPIKIDIPKNDIVECIFEDRNSTWITNQIKYGYCNIRITFREEQQSSIKQNLKSILQRILHILNWIVNNFFKIWLLAILLLGIYIFIIGKTSNNVEENPIDNNNHGAIIKDTLKQNNIKKEAIDRKKNSKNEVRSIIIEKETFDSKASQKSINNNNIRKSESFKKRTLEIPSNFILVPGGNLSWKGNIYDDYKVHKAYVDSFYISAYELTQGEYEKVMGKLEKFNYMWLEENTWHVDDGPIYNEVKGNNIPVRGTLKDFIIYCNMRSKQEGYDGFYIIKNNTIEIKKNGNGYRLVTPYEWIYAAFGGQKNIKQKYLGGKELSEVAWHYGNSKRKPHPVGLKKPNIIGIYDMQGNAREILQGDKNNKFYISMFGGYNISDFNYPQTYDVTYIWESDESDSSIWCYGARIAFVPKNLTNNNTNFYLKEHDSISH